MGLEGRASGLTLILAGLVFVTTVVPLVLLAWDGAVELYFQLRAWPLRRRMRASRRRIRERIR
jgi:hypothetical protein